MSATCQENGQEAAQFQSETLTGNRVKAIGKESKQSVTSSFIRHQKHPAGHHLEILFPTQQ